ncbi:hypothetical protein ABZS66_61260 [Dactylosporangium sp. NPDC005572]|uniref:hypothetical protein n=1 Tax=Dactylosporangium sp. NPDC005572 TaxID=3156889 RepID=UPI0033BF4A16
MAHNEQGSALLGQTIHDRATQILEERRREALTRAEALARAWTKPDAPRRRVQSLTDATRLLRVLRERTRTQVVLARRLGANWDQVATSLQVTRQAAWARYHEASATAEYQTGRQSMSGALRSLDFLRRRTERLEAKTASLVAAARQSGRTWENIADDLGVRRQTAWERYGRLKTNTT